MSSPDPSRPRAATSMAIGAAVLLAVAACLLVGVVGGLLMHKLGQHPLAIGG